MLRELKTEDIAQILRMNDPVEQVFPCERGEWVQWLNQYIDNPEVYIIGKLEENKLLSYAVAISMVQRPLSNVVNIIFMSGLNTDFIDKIKIWGKSKGARQVIVQALDKPTLETLDIDMISYVGSWSI